MSIKNNIKIGRNDPCHCGSGKKYKKCCLIKDRKISNSYLPEGDLMDNNSNEKIGDNPSAKKMKESLEGMKMLKNATEMGLFDGLIPFGLDKDKLSDAFSDLEELEEQMPMLDVPDKFNEHFVERGWIAHESMNFTAMKTAVELAETGQLDEAEQVIINAYDKSLELSVKMIQWMEEFSPRNELLKLAYDDYLAGRFHSCILMLFTIIDGFVADIKEIDGNKGFFAEGEDIYAWDSIAAHKTGLTELRKLLYQNRGKTNTEKVDIPYRNGIMHGRDLNYANKKVAIKLWSTLFSLKDGIIAIKKGKPEEPKEFDLRDTIQLMKDNEVRKELLDKWEPRKLEIDVDIPENGDSSEYSDNSPEKDLIEFFEYWRKDNFGKIIEKLNYRFLEGDTTGKIIFRLKKGIFKRKTIKDYSIISIDDDSPAISDIKVNLTIQKEDKEISKEITFRMVFERENGDIEIRGMQTGSWKIYKGIYEIKEL